MRCIMVGESIMNEQQFIRKLTRYYRHHRQDMVNPRIRLDWVNTSGWESEIYAYTLAFGRPNQRRSVKRVLRLMTGASLDGAAGEYHMLKILHRAGYPVPQGFALGGEGDGLEKPFIIMARIKGKSFAARFPRSPEDDQQPLRDFVSLFRRLHTLAWQPFLDHEEGASSGGEDPFFYFDREMAFYEPYISLPEMSGFREVLKWVFAQRERVPCRRGSVIHQDYHPDNILEDEQGALVVIDWTGAKISDYRFDMAWTLTLMLCYGGQVRRRLVLDEYERQMGGVVPSLDVFEAVAIVRRIGSVMISLGSGADTLGMRNEAVEAMRRDRVPLTRLYDRMTELVGFDVPQIRAFLADLP